MSIAHDLAHPSTYDKLDMVLRMAHPEYLEILNEFAEYRSKLPALNASKNPDIQIIQNGLLTVAKLIRLVGQEEAVRLCQTGQSINEFWRDNLVFFALGSDNPAVISAVSVHMFGANYDDCELMDLEAIDYAAE